jgi:hypothetical protein
LTYIQDFDHNICSKQEVEDCKIILTAVVQGSTSGSIEFVADNGTTADATAVSSARASSNVVQCL